MPKTHKYHCARSIAAVSVRTSDSGNSADVVAAWPGYFTTVDVPILAGILPHESFKRQSL